MRVQLESTEKIVTLVVNGVDVPARIWEGETEAGVPIHAYITRVAVAKHQGPEDMAVFERELKEQRPPTPEIMAIPLRMIL